MWGGAPFTASAAPGDDGARNPPAHPLTRPPPPAPAQHASPFVLPIGALVPPPPPGSAFAPIIAATWATTTPLYQLVALGGAMPLPPPLPLPLPAPLPAPPPLPLAQQAPPPQQQAHPTHEQHGRARGLGSRGGRTTPAAAAAFRKLQRYRGRRRVDEGAREQGARELEARLAALRARNDGLRDREAALRGTLDAQAALLGAMAALRVAGRGDGKRGVGRPGADLSTATATGAESGSGSGSVRRPAVGMPGPDEERATRSRSDGASGGASGGACGGAGAGAGGAPAALAPATTVSLCPPPPDGAKDLDAAESLVRSCAAADDDDEGQEAVATLCAGDRRSSTGAGRPAVSSALLRLRPTAPGAAAAAAARSKARTDDLVAAESPAAAAAAAVAAAGGLNPAERALLSQAAPPAAAAAEAGAGPHSSTAAASGTTTATTSSLARARADGMALAAARAMAVRYGAYVRRVSRVLLSLDAWYAASRSEGDQRAAAESPAGRPAAGPASADADADDADASDAAAAAAAAAAAGLEPRLRLEPAERERLRAAAASPSHQEGDDGDGDGDGEPWGASARWPSFGGRGAPTPLLSDAAALDLIGRLLSPADGGGDGQADDGPLSYPLRYLDFWSLTPAEGAWLNAVDLSTLRTDDRADARVWRPAARTLARGGLPPDLCRRLTCMYSLYVRSMARVSSERGGLALRLREGGGGAGGQAEGPAAGAAAAGAAAGPAPASSPFAQNGDPALLAEAAMQRQVLAWQQQQQQQWQQQQQQQEQWQQQQQQQQQ